MSCEPTNKHMWGPLYWEFLHAFSVMYPTKPTDLDKENAKKLIESFSDVIPCSSCKDHFIEKAKSISFESRKQIFEDLVEIHNSVNKRLNKKIFPLEKAYKKYNRYIQSPCERSNKRTLYFIVGIFSVVLLVTIILTILKFSKRKKK